MKQLLDQLTERTGVFTSVVALTDDGVYENNNVYNVTIDRMLCGKLCMYFRSGFQPGANISYRVFKTSDELLEKFKGEN